MQARVSRALLWALIALPLLLGILAGLCVRLAVLLWAALAQGYAIGKGV